MEPSVAVLSADGDIDRPNARILAEYPLTALVRCRQLILDLTRLEFICACRILGVA
ncbi:hypothetical protein [Mycobacterium kubicae]|uniref:STAS domain-containing protein n=1 Tax=Mycobacterium kubicae TaxID=120959 RepID=A0AAX1JIJ5_9MYCO|nr:hypothetical protein [Mycobacterium kubicae]MCV7093642.1 hypothetical protein [Mycobacterium kubicae]QPI40215.1 hypothetical protein I2456_12760 [Mycobacterium kubicae]